MRESEHPTSHEICADLIKLLSLWVCVTRPLAYARSFFGVVDLLAILPTYLSLIVPGSRYFLVIRTLRVLRVFRVLKLAQYLREAQLLMQALSASAQPMSTQACPACSREGHDADAFFCKY